METIKHLPRMVHTSLHSSFYLFDMSRVVEELIFHSLDAASSKVLISLKMKEPYVKVDDNGFGITREALELLGEVHETSELNNANCTSANVESLNYRGDTLGSLSDVSLVEVITKARGWPDGYRKVMKARNCLFLGISDLRQNAGTTVIVRDLFYNQPVRQKYLQSCLKKVLHSVYKCVVRIALVHPQVSFTLADIENDNLLLSSVPSLSPLPLIADVFGNDVSDTLLEINTSDKVYELSGYLSRPSEMSPALVIQLFYINSRIVSKGPIQKLIGDLGCDHQCSISLYRAERRFQNCKRHKTQGHVSYVLNLSCPTSFYDITFEPSKALAEFKDWNHVLSFVEKSIRNFWKQQSVEISQGSIWKDCSNGSESYKKTPISRMPTDYIFAEKDPASVTFSENDLSIPAYQSSHELFNGPPDGTSEYVLDCGYCSDIANVDSDKESLNFSSTTPCQEKIAGWSSPFILKTCKRKLGFLPSDLELDHDNSDELMKKQSHSTVLEIQSFKMMNKLDSECLFSSPIPLAKNIRRNFPFRDEYISNIDVDDVCSGEVFESCDQGSVDLKATVDLLQFASEDVENVETRMHSHGTLLARGQFCHRSNSLQRRSHSAPPFCRRKSKFSSLGSDNSYGISLGHISLHYPSVVKETGASSKSFVKNPPSSRTSSSMDFRSCSQYGQRDCDVEMPPAYYINRIQCLSKKVDYQPSSYSNAGSAHLQNHAAESIGNEINLQNYTAKQQDDNLQFPRSMVHVERDHKVYGGSDNVLNIAAGFLSLAGSFLQPETISMNSLKNAKVLLQLDKKFIPVVADGVLAVIDQHAADERIRLEELKKKILCDGETGVTYLDAEQELMLPEIGYQMLQKYIGQIKKWGWICSMQHGCSESFSRNLNTFKRRRLRPNVKLNAVPCILGINLTDNDLMEFLEQLAETDGSAVVPPAINRLLNSKACRGAIMFGDTLLPAECSLLVEELKKTSLCFQCAHGRPTAAPVVNMVELHKQLSNLQLQTRKHADCWHSLTRHKPSLERTQRLLSAARRFHHC